MFQKDPEGDIEEFLLHSLNTEEGVSKIYPLLSWETQYGMVYFYILLLWELIPQPPIILE